MKLMKRVLLMNILAVSFTTQASTFIRVINNSSQELQAMFQAGGCIGVDEDWNGDTQYTLCRTSYLPPHGGEVKNEFSALESDRSVKVFSKTAGRIAYCNSMDYSSVTITGGENDKFNVEYTCPYGRTD